MTELGTRRFTVEDQLEFVRFSGDANPIHADATLAAQMFPGGIIVHGMNSLSWALELAFARDSGFAITAVRATFLKPILLDEDVTATLKTWKDGLRLTLTGQNGVVTHADLVTGGPIAPTGEATVAEQVHVRPIVRNLDALEGIGGSVTMSRAALALTKLFPTLTARVGAARVLGLSSLATLVGMECPGLYGVSTDVDVAFGNFPGALHYSVIKVDKRFSRASMAVSGYGLSGTVTAFVNAPKSPKA